MEIMKIHKTMIVFVTFFMYYRIKGLKQEEE